MLMYMSVHPCVCVCVLGQFTYSTQKVKKFFQSRIFQDETVFSLVDRTNILENGATSIFMVALFYPEDGVSTSSQIIIFFIMHIQHERLKMADWGRNM
jgi:hypothetical protein